jgi:hypothetical protein
MGIDDVTSGALENIASDTGNTGYNEIFKTFPTGATADSGVRNPLKVCQLNDICPAPTN